MKIGFQTIVWWPFTDDLEYRLKVIAAAGYQGVEFKERPDELSEQLKQLKEQAGEWDIGILRKLLDKYNLKLIGLSGGSLRSRMDFCKDFRPEYLYTDDWNDEIAKLVEDSGNTPGGEFTLALHPHVFKPAHSLKMAQEILKRVPKLKFLPDTAHLTIAGDDPVGKEAIQAFKELKGRIAAVHIKDWTSAFGRSAHRYARGFVELGEGEVKLDEVLKVLKEIGHNGWLVVEQDYTKTDPAISTFNCASWLADRGLLTMKQERPAERPQREGGVGANRCAGENEAHFLKTVVSAGWQDLQLCYEVIAQAFLELCECELVTVWTCSPAHRLMNLVAIKPEISIQPKTTLDLERQDMLTRDTVEEQTIRRFDLTDPDVRKRFGWPELLNVIKSKWMVSIPVFNPWNPNHVRLVMNIFNSSKELPISDEALEETATAIGHATSSALDQVCSMSATNVNALVGKSKRAKDSAERLTGLVQKMMECEDVAIWLRNPIGNRLERIGESKGGKTSGQIEKWYSARGNSFGEILERKEPFMMPRDWWEIAEEGEGDNLLEWRGCTATPFVRSDGVFLGFICCCAKWIYGKLDRFRGLAFSDDDEAILEAIIQAAMPHLEVLIAQERREKALGRLTHELKTPLVAIRGATQLIMKTPRIMEVFDYDYPRDIWSWTDLMGRLIDNADAFRHSNEKMVIEPTQTYLLADIIAPVTREARLLLEERGFGPEGIRYDKERFKKIPALWIDRNGFQQVMFNLLSNAIKYAYNDTKAFNVEIDAEERGMKFVIIFRDFGLGIEVGMEEAIFEEGVRGQDAAAKNVAGQGLGLWVVRQIVERHEGTIGVTNLQFPTEFTISLPYSLTSRPPS